MDAGFSPSMLRWFGSAYCGPVSTLSYIYDFADCLLRSNVHLVPYVEVEAALSTWSHEHSQAPLSIPASFTRKSQDTPVVKAVADHLLRSASDERSRARLLASTCAEYRAHR